MTGKRGNAKRERPFIKGELQLTNDAGGADLTSDEDPLSSTRRKFEHLRVMPRPRGSINHSVRSVAAL